MFGRKKGNDVAEGDQNEALTKALTGMTELMQQMPTMIATSVSAAVGEAVKGIAPQPAPPPAPAAPVLPTDEELEAMSHTERNNHLLGRIRDEVMKPVSEKLTAIEGGAARGSRRQAFVNYATANPEILHYEEEVREVLKRQPALDPQDVFVLAKGLATNEKRAEVEKAMKPEQEQEEEGEETVAEVLSFFPTVAQKKDNAGRMGKDEAAEDAFTSVFGDVKEIGG